MHSTQTLLNDSPEAFLPGAAVLDALTRLAAFRAVRTLPESYGKDREYREEN